MNGIDFTGKSITFGSVCSGIEAASVAWDCLGWSAAWLSQYDPCHNYKSGPDFPSAVLEHHYPDVKNLGDMTKISEMILSGDVHAPDILVGGTPCQAFSVAGMREGLADPRGELTIRYVELANAIDNVRRQRGDQPAIIVWENVPGVLSSKDNAFGCFLGALAGESSELQPAGKKWSNAGCVYGPKRAIAWRILDAQYFGLAQRRKRVFLVASARDGFDPAKVLFEFDSVRRDIAPSRETQKEPTADAVLHTFTASHWDGAEHPHPTLSQSHNSGGIGSSNQELFSQRGSGIIAMPYRMVAFGEYADDESASTMKARDYKDATDLVCVHGTQDPIISMDRAHSLGRNAGQENAVLIEPESYGIPGNWIGRKPENGGNAVEPMHDISPCLTSTDRHAVAQLRVRRLTPVECERLQGFPDNYTQIEWRGKPAEECPDGHRYKALGNSMAVPCMAWIGKRIQNLIEEQSWHAESTK